MNEIDSNPFCLYTRVRVFSIAKDTGCYFYKQGFDGNARNFGRNHDKNIEKLNKTAAPNFRIIKSSLITNI